MVSILKTLFDNLSLNYFILKAWKHYKVCPTYPRNRNTFLISQVFPIGEIIESNKLSVHTRFLTFFTLISWYPCPISSRAQCAMLSVSTQCGLCRGGCSLCRGGCSLCRGGCSLCRGGCSRCRGDCSRCRGGCSLCRGAPAAQFITTTSNIIKHITLLISLSVPEYTDYELLTVWLFTGTLVFMRLLQLFILIQESPWALRRSLYRNL